MPTEKPHNVAVAHLRPGDQIISGLGTKIPQGTVERCESFLNDHFGAGTDFESTSSHLFQVTYTDGAQSEKVNGSRHLMVYREEV